MNNADDVKNEFLSTLTPKQRRAFARSQPRKRTEAHREESRARNHHKRKHRGGRS